MFYLSRKGGESTRINEITQQRCTTAEMPSLPRCLSSALHGKCIKSVSSFAARQELRPWAKKRGIEGKKSMLLLLLQRQLKLQLLMGESSLVIVEWNAKTAFFISTWTMLVLIFDGK